MSVPEVISDSERTSAEATANRLLEVVRDIVTELHPRQAAPGAVSLDSALDRDLALDSLGRVELLARIEKTFDVSLPEAAFANAETPRDLLRAIVGATGRRDAAAASEVADVSLGEARGAPPSAETLVDVLRWHVASHPERPHVRLYEDEGDGTVITYRDLLEGAERIAAGLQARDLQPGEAVAIMLPTGAEYFMSFFGALIAGGIPIPVYPPARLAQVEEHMRRHAVILANAAAAVLVTVPEAQRFAGFLMSGVASLRHVVTPDELTAATEAPMTPAIGAQDTAFLQYTSGSTGNPKGVVLTHANLLANIQAMTMALETTPDDVLVSWLPLYHDMGLIAAWLGSLHQAMPLVIMSPLSFLARPRRWLWAIHRYQGTISAAPNFAYELCLRRIDDADIEGLDLGSWRMAANGAEAVSPDTVERFCARFADYGFRRETMMPMFGLAENCVGLAFPPLDRGPLIDRIERRTLMEAGRALPSDDPGALRVVACGRPLPGHQVRIVDENDRELPERQEGRLQFTGPSATSGYFRNPESTRELFHGDWLDSGDLAYVAGGDVYITGRRKDVIIRGGRNVYPAELEEAVGDLEGVRSGNVAVFASTDADTGTERLIVVAETRKTQARTRDDLTARINALAQDLIAMPPDDVVLAPPNTVPKTSSGKVRRGRMPRAL